MRKTKNKIDKKLEKENWKKEIKEMKCKKKNVFLNSVKETFNDFVYGILFIPKYILNISFSKIKRDFIYYIIITLLNIIYYYLMINILKTNYLGIFIIFQILISAIGLFVIQLNKTIILNLDNFIEILIKIFITIHTIYLFISILNYFK